MKRKLCLVSGILFALPAFALSACGDFTDGLEFTASEDGSYYICSGIGEATAAQITIPSEHKGKPVTGIGPWAFDGCENLTAVNYGGTTEGWGSIVKGLDWNADTGEYEVNCTDGTAK